MSTNISKKKRDDLLDKIKQIRAFIAAAPQDENTGNLLSYLSELEKDVNGKKYGLVFEEHREEIDEVLDTHTPVLTEDADLFIDHGGQMNFLLEGDNLAALKLLEKTHRGKIDLIYIDPPYNRGKTDFVYDDDFVVNEDTFRHSKWISFMKSRLEAAKRLLTEAGLVFISIDDNEVAALKLLCDEVFGADFFINLFVWQRNSSAKTEKGKFTVNTEYVLLYAKSGAYTLNSAYKPLSDASQKLFKFDDNDGRGKYQTVSLQKPRDPGPETTYDYADNTGKVWPCPTKGWRMKYEKIKALENDNSFMNTIIRKLFDKNFNYAHKILALEPREVYAFVLNNADRLRHLVREAMAAERAQMQLDVQTKSLFEFHIPQSCLFTYNGEAKTQIIYKKNVYQNYLSSAAPRSTPEVKFEKFCEHSGNVEWWYKNGDKGSEYFSIVYGDNSEKQKLFYPDYIVGISGEIWIIETKGGFDRSGNSQDIDIYTPKKFEALKAYLDAHGLKGGIVRNDATTDELCICMEHYSDDIGSDDWVLLENILG